MPNMARRLTLAGLGATALTAAFPKLMHASPSGLTNLRNCLVGQAITCPNGHSVAHVEAMTGAGMFGDWPILMMVATGSPLKSGALAPVLCHQCGEPTIVW